MSSKYSLRHDIIFDVLYTRQFRRDIKENKKKILSGTEFAKELNAKNIAAFSNRRVQYDIETKTTSDETKQQEWEEQIQVELAALKDFKVE